MLSSDKNVKQSRKNSVVDQEGVSPIQLNFHPIVEDKKDRVEFLSNEKIFTNESPEAIPVPEPIPVPKSQSKSPPSTPTPKENDNAQNLTESSSNLVSEPTLNHEIEKNNRELEKPFQMDEFERYEMEQMKHLEQFEL